MLASMLLFAAAWPDGLARGVMSWEPEGLGNHRFVVEVTSVAESVRVVIPWRRRDTNPQAKAVVVLSATGQAITRVRSLQVSNEVGEFVFEPSAGAGLYYFYYLPYTTEGTNYPKVTYASPQPVPEWSAQGVGAEARVLRYEAISEFHAFNEMEVIATAAERAGLLANHPGAPYLVFPEDRTRSIRMTDHLPFRWTQTGANRGFGGGVRRGEYFTYQLGLWAAHQAVSGVSVRFSDLIGPDKGVIRKAGATCFNTGGIDYRGEPFSVDLKVAHGKVQPLWCGLQVPEDIPPGEYRGSVVVAAQGRPEVRLPFALLVSKEIAPAHGDDDPFSMSRLRWLNSTLAEDDSLVRPFQHVIALGNRVELLGRRVTLGGEGLPAQIETFFDPRMTRLKKAPTALLAGSMRLVATMGGKSAPMLGTTYPRAQVVGEGAAEWNSESRGAGLVARCEGRLEFEGTMDLAIAVTAEQDLDLQDLQLEIPIRKELARYLMGLGRPGGAAPESLEWKWDVKHNQEGAWVGDVHAGLQFALRDERYARPLNTNFYHEKPLVMPSSWDNGGKGGIRIATDGGTYRIVGFSGPRKMKKGEVLRFDVHLMVTPFKLIDPTRHFSERYFHAFKPLDEVASDGANVINIHHATAINPWINYPFLEPAKMKAYIDDAHARGMRVKIYNTIRELTNRAPELFMLRSLGHEVFSMGPGGGYSWLQEHVGDDYIAAWHVPAIQDAALINSGMSRWHNFYVEGMDWLARNQGIDGLYLDDVAFDRITMKRVRKVLDRHRPAPLIDFHSANQFNPKDGWNNSALLYMEHLPFIDRVWFGEYFDYGKAPDFWMVEVSGLPFGVMGEMLQDGGNPWRGMLFGMTARRPWAGDPRPLWKAWDAFGIVESEMIGWWAPDCPVRTSNPLVLATVYQREGKTLIALASWAPETEKVKLQIDWKALGLDPLKARLAATPIEGFQPEATFTPTAAIPVEPGKGWLLVVE